MSNNQDTTRYFLVSENSAAWHIIKSMHQDVELACKIEELDDEQQHTLVVTATLARNLAMKFKTEVDSFYSYTVPNNVTLQTNLDTMDEKARE